MTTRRAVAAGLLTGALFGPCLARAQALSSGADPAPSPTDTSVAAAEDLSRRMTVPVLVNGVGPFPFVVDTGSNRSVISDVLALQLNLPMSQALKVHAATGMVSTGSVRVSSLSVAKRTLAEFDAPVLTADNIGALGMLGIDAVAKERIVLDFRRKRMTVTDSRPRTEPGEVVVRAKSKYGQLLLVDSWVEGIPIYVIIDTGGEMTIGNAKLRTLLAKRRSGYPEPVTVTSVTGDAVIADLSFIPRVEMGHLYVTNQQIAYADLYAFRQLGLEDKPAMLLGMSTLRHFDKVLVDFPARQVSFSFNTV